MQRRAAGLIPGLKNSKVHHRSNPNAAILALSVHSRFRNGACHLDFKRFDDDAHVLARVFLTQMFSYMRFDIFFPEAQNLPLIACKRLQHFPDIVAAIQSFFNLPGVQGQAFDDGKFHACRRVPMANGSDVRQVNVMLPLRAVVSLDDAAGHKQGGFEGIVRGC